MTTKARTAASKILRHRIELEGFEGDWTAFPIDPGVIPDYMGINLCSVEAIRWSRHADDGQLVEFAIEFLPSREDEPDREWRSEVIADEAALYAVRPSPRIRMEDRLVRHRVEMDGFCDFHLLPLNVMLALPEAGIHVRHVEAVRWTRLAEDGQLVEVALEFRPYAGGRGDPARLREILAREEALHRRPPLRQYLANRVRKVRMGAYALAYKLQRLAIGRSIRTS